MQSFSVFWEGRGVVQPFSVFEEVSLQRMKYTRIFIRSHGNWSLPTGVHFLETVEPVTERPLRTIILLFSTVHRKFFLLQYGIKEYLKLKKNLKKE